YSLSESLNLEVNKKILSDRPVFVFSGSARGTSQTCWFLNEEKSKLKNVRFVPFQEGEDALIRRFIDFMVRNRGYQTRDTAILSEDETSYGYSNPSEADGKKPADSRCELGYGKYDTPHGSEATGSAQTKEDDSSHQRLLKLQFPRGISHFRAAYQ